MQPADGTVPSAAIRRAADRARRAQRPRRDRARTPRCAPNWKRAGTTACGRWTTIRTELPEPDDLYCYLIDLMITEYRDEERAARKDGDTEAGTPSTDDEVINECGELSAGLPNHLSWRPRITNEVLVGRRGILPIPIQRLDRTRSRTVA
jgi:hypothetical protein